MNVTQAIQARRSIRAFQSRSVDPALIREALSLAAKAPSGGNLQPWRLYLLAGDELTEFKQSMTARINSQPMPDKAEYEIYPKDLPEPYRSERKAAAEAMYSAIGIAREDKMQRLRFAAGNLDFWGAPVGLLCYIDRRLSCAQWADLGMYLQSLMLLLQERGIDSCPQAAWAHYHSSVNQFLQPPDDLMLFCGMSIGYADLAAPVNTASTARMALDDFAQLRGF